MSEPAKAASPNGRPRPKPESKLICTQRLKKEGRWEEATLFKDEVLRELHEQKIWGAKARDLAWQELMRMFPPLPPKEEEPQEKKMSAESKACAEAESSALPAIEAEAMEKMLENVSPIDLPGDIRWVYSQLENKGVRPDQAPSAGAWSLLGWARKYQSRFFEQLLPKSLAKASDDDVAVKREKRRIEEIEAILERLAEQESDVPPEFAK